LIPNPLPAAKGQALEVKREAGVLASAILITSLCAIVYELLISSLSAYLLGSSVLHFSLTIGLFMSFMGVGSYLSKFISVNLLDRFVLIENCIGLLGGLSAFLLYLSFSTTEYYYIAAFLLIAAISTCVGLEIPLVTRLLRESTNLKDALANILAVDYIGALAASILFPLVLLPYLGMMRTAFLVGVLNVSVAGFLAIEFKAKLPRYRQHLAFSGIAALLLLGGCLYSFRIVGFLEQYIYQDQVVYAEQSTYQRIILTKFRDDIRLFLDGNIQFSSMDEYRYHEALVHIPLSLARNREEVLLLGAGDGLAVREVLKYPDVQRVTVVDLDPAMTELGKENPMLRALNQNSLHDKRVQIINKDAYQFLDNSELLYSVIISDLPDPNNLALGKLYSREFYEIVKRRLAADGIFATQASSPYFAREPFWCVHATLQSVFDEVRPLQVYVPSFGPWGFQIASRQKLGLENIDITVPTRWLSARLLSSLLVFDNDTSEIPTEINRLDNQILLSYYEKSWEDWN
jgi:spermidine synthase